MEKKIIFHQSHATQNPFNVFGLFERLVILAYKGVFSFTNIVKHFVLAYMANIKKHKRMATFAPKPRVNPFGKMSIFRCFELVVFIA